MTWTVPATDRPDGSLSAPEPELLRGILDFHRATLLSKCAGLTGDQLATASVPNSNLTLLGLIRHMSKVERTWFRIRFRGEDLPILYSTPDHKDADFEDLDPVTAETAYQLLLDEQELARQAVAGAGMDDTFVHPSGEDMSLRMIFVHMIGEYARHNGHADMIRQQLDGVAGY
jgi:uncharacterized damage-inducible protein DinB